MTGVGFERWWRKKLYLSLFQFIKAKWVIKFHLYSIGLIGSSYYSSSSLVVATKKKEIFILTKFVLEKNITMVNAMHIN